MAESVTRDIEPDALARAIWTFIAEPQDEDAGELIKSAGAERTLALTLGSNDNEYEGIALSAIRERALPRANPSSLHRVLQTSARFGVGPITPGHVDWPSRLDDLGPRARSPCGCAGTRSCCGQNSPSPSSERERQPDMENMSPWK